MRKDVFSERAWILYQVFKCTNIDDRVLFWNYRGLLCELVCTNMYYVELMCTVL